MRILIIIWLSINLAVAAPFPDTTNDSRRVLTNEPSAETLNSDVVIAQLKVACVKLDILHTAMTYLQQELSAVMVSGRMEKDSKIARRGAIFWNQTDGNFTIVEQLDSNTWCVLAEGTKLQPIALTPRTRINMQYFESSILK